MSTKTHTVTTHYHIQKKRRAAFIDEWRKYRQTVIRKEDVALVPTARGLRTGVYMGWDGDRPTRCLDALVHEIDPGTVTTIHRHSWDAILFMVEGSGWTEVDGVRYDWKPWDAIHLPAWSWHRHGNDGDRPGRFMS
jgi:gentisate 1,2-dioxygenase